jgi:rhodanese-related sulfurtransferase
MVLRLKLIFLLLMSSLISPGANIPVLTPAEAAEQLKAGVAVLIDVRESDEWAETGVAEPAVLLALSDLRGERTTWKAFLEKNRDKALLLYCRSGGRSAKAAELLAKEGFKTANAGGFKAWSDAGLPVRKP